MVKNAGFRAKYLSRMMPRDSFNDILENLKSHTAIIEDPGGESTVRFEFRQSGKHPQCGSRTFEMQPRGLGIHCTLFRLSSLVREVALSRRWKTPTGFWKGSGGSGLGNLVGSWAFALGEILGSEKFY